MMYVGTVILVANMALHLCIAIAVKKNQVSLVRVVIACMKLFNKLAKYYC